MLKAVGAEKRDARLVVAKNSSDKRVNSQLRAVRDRFLQPSLANAAALQHVRVQHRFAFTESAQSAIDRLTAVIHQRFGKRKALVIKCRITQSMARADLQFGSAPATNPGAPAIEPERLQRAGRS